ncbi:glucose-6-phosphate dehydrogenase [Desulfopila sp. IMCC35008]|uniref:glucose-6-phosphate dehydrogenase n=1 Tax=Desulfopila sp. IMCC35008 TaxID=2653858 RepID=UPI00271537E8|nr:glucose-6-phosphate dehydrogenase [Desulfopila sp. IMCC35008]
MTLESQMIIIFGATGDLNRRKLIPSLYHLVAKHRLTECTPIICIGRKNLSRDEFITHLSVEDFIKAPTAESMKDLLRRIEYVCFDITSGSSELFAHKIMQIQQQYGCTDNKLIYLALPTSVFHTSAQLIDALDSKTGWKRVVFEKPFGADLHSAQLLNDNIRNILKEDEIYRVDHYLGKELVQNILTLRFANDIFSGAWNNEAIDHVQITVSETLGVEKRAGYYDQIGAVRDMLQNHLLQLLSFVAMEPPIENSTDGLRDEALSVMQSLRPLDKTDIVLGQYGPGTINSKPVNSYLAEAGVKKNSTTETFVAIRAFIDTNRWQGVPFYLRTGKRLEQRYADIKIVFKQRKHHIINRTGQPNTIIIRIQPNSGIAIAFNVQKPGEEDSTESVLMDFCHHCHFGPNTPEAYESILYNIMLGDHSLFPRRDWIEASWAYIDRLRSIADLPVIYSAGSLGPAKADTLLTDDGREWLHEKSEAQALTLANLK